MDNNYTHLPAPHNKPVQTTGLLALMAHFATCSKIDSVNKTWGGPLIQVGTNGQRYGLIVAALDHAETCMEARIIVARHPNLYFSTEEPVMTVAEEPRPNHPTALDIASNALSGVVLVANILGNEQHFDLLKVANRLTLGAAELRINRIKTANIVTVEIVHADNWGDGPLDKGQELNLHQITGNGQFLVVGEWSYTVEEIRDLLKRDGNLLRIDGSYTTLSTWDMPQVPAHPQGRHAASANTQQSEANGEQLLTGYDNSSDVYIGDTGLTRLPPEEDKLPEEDPEYYDRELDSTFGTGYWFTHAQRWVLLVLGASTLVSTISTIMVLMAPHDRNSGGTLSLMSGIIGGIMLTLGTGLLGALATDKLANRPLFVECDHHAQWVLWVCGAVIGWMVLCAINVIALIVLPFLS